MINLYSKIIKRQESRVRKISLFPIIHRKKCIMILLFVIILLGAALRFYELTSRPFIADESISTMAAIDISQTGYPPTTPRGEEYWRSILHTTVMGGFFQIFGISVFIARIPSVILGTFTIPLIYLFGKEMKNRKVGLISAFFLSINFLAIDLSREARMYAFFQFFYLLSLFFFYKGFESKKDKTYNIFKNKIVLENISVFYLVLAGFFSVISLLCHRLTVMIFPSILGYALLIGYIKRNRCCAIKGQLDKYLSLFILGIIILVLGIIIGLSTGYRHQITSLFPHIGFNISGIIRSTLTYGLYILEHFPIEFGFAFVGIVSILYRKNKSGAFLIILLLLPLIIQLLFFDFNWVGPKYIFHLIPFFLILGAIGIYDLADYFDVWDNLKNPEKIIPRFFAILLVLALIFAGSSYAYLATHRGKMVSPYWKDSCEYVLFNSENDTVIVTSVALIPIFYLGSDEYGLRHEYPQYASKNITIYNRTHLLTSSDLENITRIHDNGWVLVDRDRWNFDLVITDDTKQYLMENMTFHQTRYFMHLLVYSWGND
jgi:4-amino-4-deoxy-L-arabinose transferase-like glycosyltransferase